MTLNRTDDWRQNMFRRIGGDDLARRLKGQAGGRQLVPGAVQQPSVMPSAVMPSAVMAEAPAPAVPSRGGNR